MDNPLATLIVLFYKHERFVMDTVAGALSQTYPNLEIIFSDDNSPDGTFEAVRKAVAGYQGPHRIILNKNDRNLGLVPHVNHLLFECAHGEVLFLNGGDDISTPERVSMTMRYFLADRSLTAVTGSYVVIDKDGRQIGERLSGQDEVLRLGDRAYLSSDSFMAGGAALAVRRSVLDVFGRMHDDCQTEDSVLRFRSLLLGPVLRSSGVFLKYRSHDGNLSNDIFRLKTGPIAAQYLADLALVKDRLPAELVEALEKKVAYYTRSRSLQERAAQSSGPLRYFLLLRCRLLRLFHNWTLKA